MRIAPCSSPSSRAPAGLAGAVRSRRRAASYRPDDPGARIFAAGRRHRGHRRLPGPAARARERAHRRQRHHPRLRPRATRRRPTASATTAVNFGVVTGDALFANEPRYTGHARCTARTTTASRTPSRRARRSPSRRSRAGDVHHRGVLRLHGRLPADVQVPASCPEQGDVGGGYIDTAAALEAVNAATRTTSRTSSRSTSASRSRSRTQACRPRRCPRSRSPTTGSWRTT